MPPCRTCKHVKDIYFDDLHEHFHNTCNDYESVGYSGMCVLDTDARYQDCCDRIQFECVNHSLFICRYRIFELNVM